MRSSKGMGMMLAAAASSLTGSGDTEIRMAKGDEDFSSHSPGRARRSHPHLTSFHKDPQPKAIARQAFLKAHPGTLSEGRRIYSIFKMIDKGMWAYPSKDPQRDTVWLGNFEMPYQQALSFGVKIFAGDAKRNWLSKSITPPVDPFAAFKKL